MTKTKSGTTKKRSASLATRPEEFSKLRRRLLTWFDDHQRQMPWRANRDPYAVWVSEIMLQQTRVSTVVEYFERWMERFPSLQALATAPIEEVLEHWAGLGYYRRARHLHRAAAMVYQELDGEIPDTVQGLRALPGVGPYTAGAIASIAFGKAEPLVDGNVMRVLCRLEMLEGDPERGATKKTLWKLAALLVDPERPGDFNQALMELGSEVCSVRNPGCEGCPVSPWCAAGQAGRAEEFPHKAPKKAPRPMRALSCVVWRKTPEQAREFLLRRRPSSGLLAGLWEFPTVEVLGERWPESESLLQLLAGNRESSSQNELTKALGEVEHVFSHRHLKTRVYAMELTEFAVDEEAWRWVAEEELGQVAASALLEKVRRSFATASPE